VIDSFRDEYLFLSNFYPAQIKIGDFQFMTLEHAYQAYKPLTVEEVERIVLATSPGIAKSIARKVKLRPDWEEIKVPLMRYLVHEKFYQNTDLWLKLKDTGKADLVEVNVWRDRFWGVCAHTGQGLNHLGRILMEVRSDLLEYKKPVPVPGLFIGQPLEKV
jgi:ribA/ribD-fused uncharacterized protein